MANLTVEIVAEDHFVWEGQAQHIKVKIPEGSVGLLPGHTPLLATLVPGDLEIEPAEGQEFIVQVSGGFLSLDSDRVVVVADDAQLVKE